MGSGRLLAVRIHATRDLAAETVALFLEGDFSSPLARTNPAHHSAPWDQHFTIDATKHIAAHLAKGLPVPRNLVFRLYDEAQAVVGDALLPLKILLKKGAADGFLPVASTAGSLRVAARLKRVKAASMLTDAGSKKLAPNLSPTPPATTNGSSALVAGAAVATVATAALAAYLVRKRAKRRAKRSGASKPHSDSSATPVNLANIHPASSLASSVASGLKTNGNGPTSTAALKRAKANDAKATGNRTPSSISAPGCGVKRNNATKSGVSKPVRRPAGAKGGGGGKVLVAAAAAAATAGAIGLGAKLVSDNSKKQHDMRPGFGYTWSDDSSSDGETLRPWWNMSDASSASDSWTCDRGWSSDDSSNTFTQPTSNTSQLSLDAGENPSMDVDVNVVTNEMTGTDVRSLGTTHANVSPAEDSIDPASVQNQQVPPENGHEGEVSPENVEVDALNMSDVEAAWADIEGGAGNGGDPHAEMDVLDGPGIEDALAGLENDETQPIDEAAVEAALANLEAGEDVPGQSDGDNIEMETPGDAGTVEAPVEEEEDLDLDEDEDEDEIVVEEEYEDNGDPHEALPAAPDDGAPEGAPPEGEAPADDAIAQEGEDLDLDGDDSDVENEMADLGIVDGDDQDLPEDQQQQQQQQQDQQADQEGIWEDDSEDGEYEMVEDDDDDDEVEVGEGEEDVPVDEDDDEDEEMGDNEGGDDDDDEDEAEAGEEEEFEEDEEGGDEGG